MLDPDVSAMSGAYADVDAAKTTMWQRMRDECHSDEDVARWVDDNPAWATVRDGVTNMRRVLSMLEGSGDG